MYGQIKQDIGVILRKLCQQKGVEIIEAKACPDHIHMLVSIPPGISKEKEQPDDFRPACEFKVQIWKPPFLGKRVLCGYNGEK